MGRDQAVTNISDITCPCSGDMAGYHVTHSVLGLRVLVLRPLFQEQRSQADTPCPVLDQSLAGFCIG